MLRIIKGQQFTLLMVMKNNEEPVDLTPFTIQCVLKNNTIEGTTAAVLAITDQESANGVFHVSANTATTATFPEGVHPLILRITRTSDGAIIGDSVLETTIKRGITL